ncbi:MAG: glycosyltransferase family 2 protein [Ferruginibacter sp.]
MIYIVIPVFNRLHFTIKCLNSLVKQSYQRFTIIVVNDGSTDGTTQYLQTHFSDVVVCEGDGNLWWTGATNLGVRTALQLSQSDNDFVVTLNNDLEVKEDYLQCLLDAAEKNPCSLIGSVSVHIDNPGKVHFAGTKWNAGTAKYRPAISKDMSYQVLADSFDTVVTDLLPGRGVLIPITLFSKIGLYDFTAFPHYMADEDFSLRAKKINYHLLIATRAVVYNHVNETGMKKQARGWKYYKDVFTSIKSPVNFHNRWNWAKRHAGIFPPFYFLFDMTRILKGLLFRS